MRHDRLGSRDLIILSNCHVVSFLFGQCMNLWYLTGIDIDQVPLLMMSSLQTKTAVWIPNGIMLDNLGNPSIFITLPFLIGLPSMWYIVKQILHHQGRSGCPSSWSRLGQRRNAVAIGLGKRHWGCFHPTRNGQLTDHTDAS